jgi:hypothetical protein
LLRVHQQEADEYGDESGNDDTGVLAKIFNHDRI